MELFGKDEEAWSCWRRKAYVAAEWEGCPSPQLVSYLSLWGKKRESGVYISEWSWSSDTPSPVAMTEVSHWVVNSSALPTEHVGRVDANVYREP